MTVMNLCYYCQAELQEGGFNVIRKGKEQDKKINCDQCGKKQRWGGTFDVVKRRKEVSRA